MTSAFLYLRVFTTWNWIRVRAKRLRQPKYLAGALVGAAYVYYLLLRPMYAPIGVGRNGFPQAGPVAAGMAAGMGMGGAVWMLMIPVILLATVFIAWIAPSRSAGLNFSQAEISFLFPAPVRRRTLVHYHLASSQLMQGLTALVVGMIWSRRGLPIPGILGWWFLFSASSLHRIAAGLTLTRLVERGVGLHRVRLAAGAAAVLVLAAIALAIRAASWPTQAELSAGPAALTLYASRVLASGPLRVLLEPLRMVAGPFLAQGGRAFAASLPAAILVLALHYRWIVSLDVSFAEGSMALAERRARDREAMIRGPLSSRRVKAAGEPFRLGPRGRPETAFLWKNLISISVMNWRLLLILGLIVLQVLAILLMANSGAHRGPLDPAAILLVGTSALGGYLLLIGPQVARQDFRQDLSNVDLLKVLPLPGWRVALGELLAPTGLLTALAWILVATAAWGLGLAPGRSLGLTGVERLTLALCAAAIAPLVFGLQLLVPNAAALTFPAFFRGMQSRFAGFEGIGQRLIFALGQLLLILIGLFPAAVAAPLVVLASAWLIGLAPAFVLATAAVIVLLGGELAVGIWILGRQFEKIDLSTDLNAP